MKLLKNLVITLMLVCSLAISQPAWADKPPVTSNPDYIAVTEELAAATDPLEIAKLQFEKYIIETGDSFAECRNLTANPLIVYGKKSKADTSTFDNALYTLPAGGTTNEDWNCQGIYFSNGLNNDGVPVAAKIVTGTRLVARANPETGAVELNVPVTKVFQQGEANWNIPESPEVLATIQITQAPLD